MWIGNSPGKASAKQITTGLLCFIVGCLQISAAPEGKPWTSALYGPDWSPTPRLSFAADKIIQDFSYAGYAKGEKSIPDFSASRRFDVAADFGADATGATDATEAIQKAIDAAAAAGGGVVYLPAGTYRVLPQKDRRYALCIRKNGIVLRGAGPEKTFILNASAEMREKVMILFQAPSAAEWDRRTEGATKITADLMGPVVEIPVADVSSFKAGDRVIIRSDPNKEWVMDHQESDWLGEESKIGCIQFFRRVVAVNTANKVLTIDVPTRYSLKTRDLPEVYLKPGMLENVGVEELSIGNLQHPGKDGWANLDFAAPTGGYTQRLAESRGLPEDFAKTRKSAYDVHASYAVTMSNVLDGWIRNVRTFRPDANTTGCHLLSNGIRLKECRGVTVEGCYFQRPQYGGGGGNGYMYRLDNSNECLVRGCRAEASRHGFSISGMSSSGNVIFRCLDKDTARQTGSTGMERTEGRSSDHHQWFSHSNLFDNCTADNSWFEARDRFYKQLSGHATTSPRPIPFIGTPRDWRIRSTRSWSGASRRTMAMSSAPVEPSAASGRMATFRIGKAIRIRSMSSKGLGKGIRFHLPRCLKIKGAGGSESPRDDDPIESVLKRCWRIYTSGSDLRRRSGRC